MRVVTSRILEGVDVPDASMAIILSGTGSSREFIQRLGRILGKREGKQAKLYEPVSMGDRGDPPKQEEGLILPLELLRTRIRGELSSSMQGRSHWASLGPSSRSSRRQRRRGESCRRPVQVLEALGYTVEWDVSLKDGRVYKPGKRRAL